MADNNTCGHAQCQGYATCVEQLRNQMEYPMDNQSLYAGRIYDNQTAEKRCYEQGPIDNIVEGFGNGGGMNMSNILKWVLIVCVIYLLFTLFQESNRSTVVIGVPAPTEGSLRY